MFNIFDIFSQIAPVWGPSGREAAAASKIAQLASSYSSDIRTDTLGNLIVRMGRPGGKRIMVTAHMDTTGLAATYVDEKGFIRFGAVGGLAPTDIMNARVMFENGTRGVICFDEKEKISDLKIPSFFIDIGASDAESARALVSPGDFAVFCGEPFANGKTVCSPYIDDRIGCAVLLCAMNMLGKTDNDVFFVFSVQEEVGVRGARTAAYAIEPELGFAVDVTDSGDVPERKLVCPMDMGKGPAVKIMDGYTVSSPAASDALVAAADRSGIAVQKDILTFGGTDAFGIQLSRSGVTTGALSIPCRYIHSPCEMCSIDDAYQSGVILAEAIR